MSEERGGREEEGQGRGGQKLTYAECLQYSWCSALVHDYPGQKYLKCLNCYVRHGAINFTWVFSFNPPNNTRNWTLCPSIFRGGNGLREVLCLK